MLAGSMYGYPGDVNNTIPMSSMYPGGRATSYVPPTASSVPFRNNSAGELMALNQDAFFQQMAPPVTAAGGMVARPSNAPAESAGMAGKPSTWWVMFALVFVLFIWVARRYDTGQNFSNIRLSLFNGLFLTFFIVLMLNLLKVFAAKIRVPGVSDLILAA